MAHLKHVGICVQSDRFASDVIVRSALEQREKIAEELHLLVEHR
jgi:hypothetical protein